jgi:hypothetical protein
MTDTVKFTDIPRVNEIPEQQPQYLESVRTLQVGFGSKVMRADQQGMWMGAAEFADAPFSVDMDGNLVANSVTLSGYLAVGEALTDIGSGNITSTYIGSSAITSSKIATNAVTAAKINVSELSAITADIGSVTSGTVTGALIRTSSSGDRVEIDDTTDSVRIYNGSDLRIEIVEDRITFQDDTEAAIASIYATTAGNLLIAATDSLANLLISSQRDILIDSGDDISIDADDSITLNCQDLADDIFIGLGGNTFMQFADGRVYLDTYFDMNGFDITDGGNFTCVSLTETSDIRFKENVKPLTYGLSEVLQLDPISFQFKEQEQTKKEGRRIKKGSQLMPNAEPIHTQTHLGFSAQAVHKIMPELTRNVENPEEKARLYSTQIIPVLVQAIKELNAEIDLLKGKSGNKTR